MADAQLTKTSIPPELLRQFDALGEAAVALKATRSEDPSQRDAALEWLRQRRAARREERAKKAREEKRRLAVLAAGTAIVSVIAIAAFVLLRAPEPASETRGLSGASDTRELPSRRDVLP